MLIDIVQNTDNVSVSYVNDQSKIDIINIPLKYGYYRYVAVPEYQVKNETGIIPNLRSFKNNDYIKREPVKYFSKHNLMEFINYEVMVEYPEIYEKISKLNIPTPFSIDIETEITDEYGYSDQNKAENRILSISITDFDMNTLVFCIKNPKHPTFGDFEIEQIRGYVEDSLGDKANDYDFKFQVKTFESEYEMLNSFLTCINKYFQSIIGWNFLGYDWVYIVNRCRILGINLKLASPVGKLAKKKIDDDNKVEIPAHRIITDYMLLFKDSLIYNNLESYSLNYCSELVLGLQKVMYTGNLRKLYEDNYYKFIAYAIIDTILVMMIHRTTNLYSVDFFEAYYNKIFYNKISQNSISEALLYNQMRKNNKFLLDDEFNNPEERAYLGGYVKDPTIKIVHSMMGVDFSGLYPNSIITCGLSPENKVDSIKVIDGKPATISDEMKWNKYREAGNYILAPTGRIYNNQSDGIFVQIEKELINERAIYKGFVNDLYLNVQTKIENRIKELQTA